ncbi:P-loop containing nucleoside triphosphate hydrolase protein [Jaminaea rosea]|uniref:P-loop containing nucleoside triphosphate hydrolase protein n=1 Tax=Jaminaea rosea TaxID=1569628 RepID=A0A316URM7_9BASI|nr:P-loop containing nucleoside triphosphate hydrolase protein [Jaminaea rosea]PWN27946.1 P-loop containing nucleoside triphosphate hydrolase protein [Jaminaea rosea]
MAWQRPLRGQHRGTIRFRAPWPSIAYPTPARNDIARPRVFQASPSSARCFAAQASVIQAVQEAEVARSPFSPASLEEQETPTPSPSRVQLRPYQERAVSECLQAIASGVTRIGVSSPTGSGKTTMFTELIARLPPIQHEPSSSAHPPGTRVLIVVNSIELALQASSAVTRTHPHLHVEIEQGSNFKASGLADVTVATYQTLMRGEGRLEKFDPRGLKAVIVDEAHHAASKSYIQLLARFDEEVGLSREERQERDAPGDATCSTSPTSSSLLRSASRVPILGFSATFTRHDGLSLGRIFSRIVFHRDFLDMIDDKWLCPVRFTSIRSDLDLSSVKVSQGSGDYQTKSLSSFANVPGINRLIVRTWLEKAHAMGRGSTLVFCIDVQHTIDLTATFREAGIDARYLHGSVSAKERKQLLADFRAGTYPVLLNCAILTEGFDLPQIDTVVLARPTRSRNLFSQMIGRGLRLSPQTGKKDCLVIDLVGNIERGVVCTPTLFGLDPDEEMEGLSIEELKRRAEEAAAAREESEGDEDEDVDPEKVTYIDYASPRELQRALLSRKGHDHIARLSPNAWVDCGGDVYILEVPRKGFIKIERCDSGDGVAEEGEAETSASGEQDDRSRGPWQATFTRRNADMDEALAEIPNRRSFSPFRRPVSIFGRDTSSGGNDTSDGEGAAAPTLEAAVRACDTYATKRVLYGAGPQSPLIRRDAPWRRQPASESQRQLVAKRMGWQHLEESSIASDGASDAHAEETLRTLTKGKAGEMLTRLKFGFRRRWEGEVKAKNREVKAREKERIRREKERVKVGDLQA